MDKAPPIRQVSGQYHSSAWWEAGAGEGGGVEGQARVMVGLACLSELQRRFFEDFLIGRVQC